MLRRLPPCLLALALAVVSLPALAHPGHGTTLTDAVAGFMHPMLGLDHVLAMVAVGLWARFLGGKAVWLVPLGFVLCMVGGFALGLAGVNLPAVQLGIAASAVLLGVLVAVGARLPLALAVCLVAPVAVLHGHAHAAGLAGAAANFGLGFVAATSLLHVAGITLGSLLAGQRSRALAQGVGGTVAGIGLLLLGGWA